MYLLQKNHYLCSYANLRNFGVERNFRLSSRVNTAGKYISRILDLAPGQQQILVTEKYI